MSWSLQAESSHRDASLRRLRFRYQERFIAIFALFSIQSFCGGGRAAACAAALVLASASLASCTLTGGSGRPAGAAEICVFGEVAASRVCPSRAVDDLSMTTGKCYKRDVISNIACNASQIASDHGLSELAPNLAQHADQLSIIQSNTSTHQLQAMYMQMLLL